MKKHLIVCCLMALTACTQCSDKKKDQSTKIIQADKIKKKIQTIIFYFDYSPDPVTWLKKDYPEYLWSLYDSYCYKTIEHYPLHSFSYKGDVVDGELIARVYRKDSSFFEIPLTTSEDESTTMRSDFNSLRDSLRVVVRLSYSDEETRLEVRRINKEKNEDILLYETRTNDLNGPDSNWEEEEDDIVPNDGGFGKESQCHTTSGPL